MRTLRSVASIALVCTAAAAAADSGLKVDAAPGFWSGAQTSLRLHAVRLDATPLRLGYPLAADLAGRTPLAASVTGDYYFSTEIVDPTQPRTGFRASGALWIRQPGISLSDLALSSRSTAPVGIHTPLGLMPGLPDGSAYSVTTLPYLGIGYSDYSLKSGWGFWADIGLVVQSPGNVLGVGRVLSGTQGIDDLMRELRMAPMVQLGVNYSF